MTTPVHLTADWLTGLNHPIENPVCDKCGIVSIYHGKGLWTISHAAWCLFGKVTEMIDDVCLETEMTSRRTATPAWTHKRKDDDENGYIFTHARVNDSQFPGAHTHRRSVGFGCFDDEHVHRRKDDNRRSGQDRRKG